MTRLVDAYFRGLKILIALLLAAMVVLVFGNVVLRYGFNSGITVSEELSRWMFVWLTFLGAIVAMRDNGHLGVDSLIRRLPLAGKKLCFMSSYTLMLYATILVTIGCWEQAVINWDVVAPASGLSVAWFYGVGMVFGLSVVPILVTGLLRVLLGRITESELIAIRESEEEDINEIQRRHILGSGKERPATVRGDVH